MNRMVIIPRLLFALAIAVFGIQHFVNGHFQLEPMPGWAQPFLAYLVGLLFIAIAVSLTIRKGARLAALILGLGYLLNVLLFQVPQVIVNLHSGDQWTLCFEVLAIAGGALVLAGILQGNPRPSKGWDKAIDRLIRITPFFFVACLLVYSALHFVYADFIATLIPSWIPAHLFWSYFVGFAFLASAIGIAIKKKARLAAGLMGLMFYIWFLILHLPRVIASPHSEDELTSAFIALAIGSSFWLLASVLPE